MLVFTTLSLFTRISAERFSLPLANFSSNVLFPAVLITNALPLALAGGFGAISYSLFKTNLPAQIVFLSTFIIGSTVQWALVGSIVFFLLLNWSKGRN